MARIRTVKPEHWNDRMLTEISLAAHLLWIGTWNFSDDKGVFENDPTLLKSQIFPRRKDVRVQDISIWLDQLVKARYIIPFTHTDGQGYFISRTFDIHQRIDKPQPSKFESKALTHIMQEYYKINPGILPPVKEGKVKESTGRDKHSQEIVLTEGIEYPFNSENFLNNWLRWKKYKKEQHRFVYKSIDSEEAALAKIKRLSAGDEELAIAIINQSIESGWQGHFEYKNSFNGNSKTSAAGGKSGGTSADRLTGLQGLR